MENLIGRKVKGFKFDDGIVWYNDYMDIFIDKAGEIKGINENSIDVMFDGNKSIWTYPLSEIEKNLVEENPIQHDDFNSYTHPPLGVHKEIIVKDAEIVKETYDLINPNHYKNSSKEVIDMMLDIWGTEKLIAHCEMCAFKYRMRIGSKPNQLIENDLKKAQWYENKAKSLRDEK